MKAIIFPVKIPSFPIDKYKDCFVLVFHLISMQDATESWHYPELVGEQLRLELKFTCPLKHLTEPLYRGTNVFGCSC